MLEEKEPASEIKGRIETLRKKFAQLQEAPKALSPQKKEAWGKRLEAVDSVLSNIEQKLRSISKGDSIDRALRTKIDRTLQRLGVQARSMEKAFQEDRKSAHPGN